MAVIFDRTRMVMSSIKALEGGRVRCSSFITPFDVLAAPRNMSSMARTKRSVKITQPIMMPISSACHLVVESLTVNFMKAKLKYFIMISPTLLGKLKNLRAIQIKWCGNDLYALATSSQITCDYWALVQQQKFWSPILVKHHKFRAPNLVQYHNLSGSSQVH